jgi:Tfp pilus assembly PilM family ATPase
MDPFIRVQNGNASITVPYLQQIAPYASVALGLAMREVGDSDKN